MPPHGAMLGPLLASLLWLLALVLWRVWGAAAEPGPGTVPCVSCRPRAMAELRRQLQRHFLEALQADEPLQAEQLLSTGRLDIDTVLEVDDPSMHLASYKQGYWLPEHKLEKSWAMALHVCVLYNSLQCATLLIQRGAALNRMPNGKTPLHVACEASNPQSVQLLLQSGAKLRARSLSGHTALHHCVSAQAEACARLLLTHGADVNAVSSSHDEVTPLHTAARFGVPELVALYLQHGARVDALDSSLETPLMTAVFWAYDSREQSYSPQHQQVCRLLLEHGADPNAREEDHKTALHKAAWSCDQKLLQMLLEAGADPRALDLNLCSPLHYLLEVSSVRPGSTPEACFQLLLNYSAPCLHPAQFHKVLLVCHEQPLVVEVMANCYDRLRPNSKWSSSVPHCCYQRHRTFFDSLFWASCSPRSLMHLSRCALRTALSRGGGCERGARSLPLPPSLQAYVLLQPQGLLD
uniref:SOCS box domain-containing protein n=1 Tax=Knipowitschia caucasica TaxID=637954 RepID=A0AAV2K7I4_KNICA